MAILAFQKPENVLMTEASSSFAKFEFRPLEPGYGITIGNALRRILLSSLEGYAISSIKIEGVNHEFATIPGVLEDVTNIILNLKQVRFIPKVADANEETISLTISGKKQFVAGDMDAKLSTYSVLNPELVVCNIDEAYSFTIELTINKGRGYVPADEKVAETTDLQVIPIDSIYTPIRNVKYFTENYRVEQKTDYEKLILEVITDGSIHPEVALKESARILIEHFALFSDATIKLEEVAQVKAVEEKQDESFDESALEMRDLLRRELKDLDLSVRALNCLNAAKIYTLGDLVAYPKDGLSQLRNFGKKSQEELDELVENKFGLSFGMDVSKYKLDKE